MKMCTRPLVRALLSLFAPVLLFGASPARAESPQFCQVFAREWVRILVVHNLGVRNSPTATAEAKQAAQEQLDIDLKHLLDRNYAICLNRDGELNLPNVRVASDEAWLDFMRRNSIEQDAPEAEEISPPKKEEADPKVAARHKWCHAHFRTYHESDGTVIKARNRKRSQCPYPG